MPDRPTIFRGVHGEAVRQWQQVIGVYPSGAFDQETERTTRFWQQEHGMVADGIVGPKTWAAASLAPTVPPPQLPSGLEGIPFVTARHFTHHPEPRRVDLVVIHTMEAPERAGTARAVAQWFASQEAPDASAHFCVDDCDIIQCVREDDIAWHAGRVNGYSLGVEHAGYSKQTVADWQDAYSVAVLAISARLVAVLCARHGIPVRKLTIDELRAGARGICGHGDVTAAWYVKNGHTDPGPSFPWPSYLDAVAHCVHRIRDTMPEA